MPGEGTMVFPLSCDVSQEELPVMTAEDGIIRRLVEVKGVVVIRPLMTMTAVVILCHIGVGKANGPCSSSARSSSPSCFALGSMEWMLSLQSWWTPL